MMTKKNREYKTFHTTGRRDAIVAIQVVEYETGAIVASAEDEQITESQFRRAVEAEYPDRLFAIERQGGFFYARN